MIYVCQFPNALGTAPFFIFFLTEPVIRILLVNIAKLAFDIYFSSYIFVLQAMGTPWGVSGGFDDLWNFEIS